LNNARQYHTATLLPNGKVLVAGGGNPNAISSAELYDPFAGTWTATASLTTPRQSHAEILLANGMVLVAGGYNTGTTYPSAELYNPGTGTWTLTGSLSNARINYSVSMLLNGHVLASGGYTVNGSISGYPYVAELYDPNTGIWTTTVPANSRRAQHTTTILPNGKVLIAGGSDGVGSVSSAELFNPGPRIDLIKAVKPSFSALSLGTNYQLQISGNLLNWTNYGLAFTATNSSMIYPQYWDVNNWDSLFFRLKVAP
jgi:WD40 repeat protein